MEFQELKIKGCYLIIPRVFEDSRGFFMETYHKKTFQEKTKLVYEFVQENQSQTIGMGILRGFHYQIKPFAQAKLIRVIEGKVLDVCLDLRMDSETFGKHLAIELSGENKFSLFIPEDFAHAFVSLSTVVDLQYKVSNFYAPKAERGVFWNDSNLEIDWPFENPFLNQRDANWPLLKNIPKEELF